MVGVLSILDRVASLTSFGVTGWSGTRPQSVKVDDAGRLLPIGPTRAGAIINEDTVEAMPPYARGVNLIADTVSLFPIQAELGTNPLTERFPILEQPNPDESREDTISGMVRALINHGNAVAILGPPTRRTMASFIIPVDPQRVSARRTPAGRRQYRIDDRDYDQDQILHLKIRARTGELAGRGAIQAFREALGLILETENYTADFFGNDAMPAGVLQVKGRDLTTEEAAELKLQWRMNLAHRDVAVTEEDVEFKPLAANAEEAQLIEARTFNLASAALMLDLDPEWLGAPNTTRTYQNLEQRHTHLLRFTLMRYVARIEFGFSQLIRPTAARARMNVDQFLRSDTLARYQAHAIALDKQFLTLDEVRELEHRPPMPDLPAPPPPAPMEVTPDA